MNGVQIGNPMSGMVRKHLKNRWKGQITHGKMLLLAQCPILSYPQHCDRILPLHCCGNS